LTIIIVDDERIILEGELRTARSCLPDAEIHGFGKSAEALVFCEKETVDVALLDIEMQDMNGITLADRIKDIQPRCNIIFMTAYSSYSLQAIRSHASGYMLKPMSEKQLLAEIADLRYPVESEEKRLTVRAFGDFEVFFDGKPLAFKYQKTKELFALLIDRRGALVSGADLMSVLWENDENKLSYIKQLRRDLKLTLDRVGCSDVIIKARGSMGVITAKISCDYYDWLDGTASEANSYRGEYMSQYPWAEVTHAGLEASR